jgi:hypothetical protein
MPNTTQSQPRRHWTRRYNAYCPKCARGYYVFPLGVSDLRCKRCATPLNVNKTRQVRVTFIACAGGCGKQLAINATQWRGLKKCHPAHTGADYCEACKKRRDARALNDAARGASALDSRRQSS